MLNRLVKNEVIDMADRVEEIQKMLFRQNMLIQQILQRQALIEEEDSYLEEEESEEESDEDDLNGSFDSQGKIKRERHKIASVEGSVTEESSQ